MPNVYHALRDSNIELPTWLFREAKNVIRLQKCFRVRLRSDVNAKNEKDGPVALKCEAVDWKTWTDVEHIRKNTVAVYLVLKIICIIFLDAL